MHNPDDSPPAYLLQTVDPEPRSLVSTLPYHSEQIGRYRIEKVLGEGGFGRVYLAHDDQLHRRVAIKVPRTDLLSRPEDAEAHLAEVRVVASLDHPNIVPVYDVGSTEGSWCYVVSKFIEGCDLAHKIKAARLHRMITDYTVTRTQQINALTRMDSMSRRTSGGQQSWIRHSKSRLARMWFPVLCRKTSASMEPNRPCLLLWTNPLPATCQRARSLPKSLL